MILRSQRVLKRVMFTMSCHP